MPTCAVYGCSTNSLDIKKRKRKFYTFPKDPVYSELWLSACKRSDSVNTKNARVCSLHFTEDSYYKPLIHTLLNYTPLKYRNLKPDAVPTENLPQESKPIRNKRDVQKQENCLKIGGKYKQLSSSKCSLNISAKNKEDVMGKSNNPGAIEVIENVGPTVIDSVIIEIRNDDNQTFVTSDVTHITNCATEIIHDTISAEDTHITSLADEKGETRLVEDKRETSVAKAKYETSLAEYTRVATSDNGQTSKEKTLTSSEAKWKTQVGMLCRLCIKSDFNCIPIFKGKGKNLQLGTKILRYLKIEVHPGDNLPDQVCPMCLDAVCAWDEFAQSCISTSEKLKELLLDEDELPSVLNQIGQDKKYSSPRQKVLVTNNKNSAVNQKSETNSKEQHIHNNSLNNSAFINVIRNENYGTETGESFDINSNEYIYADSDEGHIKMVTANNKSVDVSKEVDTEESKIFMCGICSVIFLNYQQYVTHKLAAHSKGAEATVKESERSGSRVEEFCRVQDVNDSVSMNKNQENATDQSRNNGNKENYNPKGSMKFKCSVCSMKFWSFISFSAHKTAAHANHKCEHCFKSFSSSYTLRKHNMIKHVSLSEKIEVKTCPVCNQQTEAFRFKKHLQSHPGFCVKCFITVPNEEEFEEHKLVHLKDYKCPTCGKGFKTSTNLKCHLETHLPDSVARRFKCPECDAVFRWKDSVKRHSALKHSATVDSVLCHICSKTYPCYQYFKIHMRQVHSAANPVQCEVCGKFFKAKKYLKQHVVCHSPSYKTANHKNRQYNVKCEKCGRVFVSRTGLTFHSRKNCTSSDSRMCYICGLILETSLKFQRHLLKHKSKPYQCNNCDRSFLSKTSRDTHMYRHTGEKPFSCVVCDKRFFSKYNLLLHSSMHTNSRPFKCQLCYKAFRCKKYLSLHTRIHTNDRRYKCDICGIAFIQGGDLKRHKQRHYRTLPCIVTSSER